MTCGRRPVYCHHMRSGRAVSFWLSYDEIGLLEEAARVEDCSRNEAMRRAVRAYRSPTGNDASAPNDFGGST